MESNLNYTPKEIVYDRGGKGQKQINNTIISTPDYKPLKTDFRLNQNYLLGEESPQINVFLATTGWNLKKMMRQLKEQIQNLILFVFQKIRLFQFLSLKWSS